MNLTSTLSRAGDAAVREAREDHAHVCSTRSYDGSTEEELMQAYVEGDRAAFRALFDALAPRVLAFLLSAVRDRAVAEDLLQLTFERVHRARFRYRLGAPVRPWLFTIAARLRLDHLRRQYRMPRQLHDLELADSPDLSVEGDQGEAVDQQMRDAKVRRALASLSDAQRIVVHLHRFEDLTFGEIGEVLGVDEGTARVRSFRAYRKLRILLLPLVEGP